MRQVLLLGFFSIVVHAGVWDFWKPEPETIEVDSSFSTDGIFAKVKIITIHRGDTLWIREFRGTAYDFLRTANMLTRQAQQAEESGLFFNDPKLRRLVIYQSTKIISQPLRETSLGLREQAFRVSTVRKIVAGTDMSMKKLDRLLSQSYGTYMTPADSIVPVSYYSVPRVLVMTSDPDCEGLLKPQEPI